MRTKYYCEKCREVFYDRKLPNLNKVHPDCGSVARIVAHEEKHEEQEGK